MSLVRHVIGPICHWSDVSLVRQKINRGAPADFEVVMVKMASSCLPSSPPFLIPICIISIQCISAHAAEYFSGIGS